MELVIFLGYVFLYFFLFVCAIFFLSFCIIGVGFLYQKACFYLYKKMNPELLEN